MGHLRRSVWSCLSGGLCFGAGCDVGDLRIASVCGSIRCIGASSVLCISDVGAGNGGALFLEKRGACPDWDFRDLTFAPAALFNPGLCMVPHVVTFSDRTVSAGALSAERGCRIVGGAEDAGAGSHLCMCGDRSLRQRSQPAGTETVSSSLRDRVYPGLGSAAGRGRRMRGERMEMECEPAFGACLCVNQ